MMNNVTGYKLNRQANQRNLFKKFSSAPIVLKTFALFAILVAIFQLVMVFLPPMEIRSVYFRIFGVETASSYGFSLFFIFALIFAAKGSRPAVLLFGIVAPLIFTGIIKCSILLNITDDGGRFKNAGIGGLVWAVIIPSVWVALILFSPRVNKFCRNILLQNK